MSAQRLWPLSCGAKRRQLLWLVVRPHDRIHRHRTIPVAGASTAPARQIHNQNSCAARRSGVVGGPPPAHPCQTASMRIGTTERQPTKSTAQAAMLRSACLGLSSPTITMTRSAQRLWPLSCGAKRRLLLRLVSRPFCCSTGARQLPTAALLGLAACTLCLAAALGCAAGGCPSSRRNAEDHRMCRQSNRPLERHAAQRAHMACAGRQP